LETWLGKEVFDYLEVMGRVESIDYHEDVNPTKILSNLIASNVMVDEKITVAYINTARLESMDVELLLILLTKPRGLRT
jgi:hypothetical protein